MADPAARRAAGERALAYVRERSDPAAVGDRLAAIVDREVSARRRRSSPGPRRGADNESARPAMSDAPMTETERRFAFGENWRNFLRVLDEERIAQSQVSLRDLLETDLSGRSFLDVGSGSGLSSLAAMRLGASRVHSLDFDEGCVACTRELRHRYFPDDPRWTIERGDALDRNAMRRLGRFDVVYSWGVLHHTGAMWEALDVVSGLVAVGGRLAIALYIDQGLESRLWLRVKRLYNAGPVGKAAVVGAFVPMFALRGLLADVVRLQPPAARYREYKKLRGMSRVHDWYDWLGGLPFEFASASEVIEFHCRRGLALVRLKEGGGSIRNHEYTFVRVADAPPAPSDALAVAAAGAGVVPSPEAGGETPG